MYPQTATLENVMNQVENTIVEQVRQMTNKELVLAVIDLQKRVTELESIKSKVQPTSGREMTDDDARRILFGDLKDKKHKEVQTELGLSYGQVYSCRLGFTFKPIHKEMKEQGIPNSWIK